MQTLLQRPGRGISAGCGRSSAARASQPRPVATAAALRSSGVGSSSSRQQRLLVHAKFSNPFDGMFSGGNKGGDADAARRAIEKSLGKSKQPPASPGSSSSSKKPAQQPGGGLSGLGGLQQQQGGGGGFGGLSSLFGKKSADGAPAEKAGFGGGGFGGAGGSGGGGGWNWGGSGTGGEGEGEADQPIQQELAGLARGMWVVFWNAALFLAVADVLHRSLDWCCQVELLLLVGAPAQAFERVASRFYNAVEWFEANCLGWRLPRDEEMMPTYKQMALFYPEEHAYTFDAYRYNMNEAEKTAFRRFYALRWWERDGGFEGDVTAAEIQKIKDKYNPGAADLRVYKAAKAEGRLTEYWAGQGDRLKAITGDASPPVPLAAPAAAAAAGAS